MLKELIKNENNGKCILIGAEAGQGLSSYMLKIIENNKDKNFCLFYSITKEIN